MLSPVVEVTRGRVAVRDRDGAIGEADPFDEPARRDERDVCLGRDAKSPRRVRVERQQQPVTFAEKEVLEIAGAKGPSRKISVSAAIGFIALFGQAVLNGVVMVTYFKQLQNTGMAPYDGGVAPGTVAGGAGNGR